MSFFEIPIISTAISLVICWALFAILCSLINEFISQVKSERGRFMKKYLLKQFQDLPNGVNWASLMYLHGSIDMLSRSPAKPTSFIDSKQFAETIINVVANSHIVKVKSYGTEKATFYSNKMLNDFKTATIVLNQSDMIAFFSQAFASSELIAGKDESIIYKNLVEHIENWFQDLTDRITLWYQKKTKQRLLWLGILLGVILNIDSIQLFSFFQANPKQSAIVQQYYQDNSNRISNLETQLQDSSKSSKDTVQHKIDSLYQTGKLYIKSLDSLQKKADLPIGWNKREILPQYSFTSNKFLTIILKLLGLIITGFAASVGAPFWFDLLKRVYSPNSNSK